MRTAEDHKHLHITFKEGTRHNTEQSKKAGRPIFDDIEHCEIRIAGDKHSVLVVGAHDYSSVFKDEADPTYQGNPRFTYAELYPDHYKAFREHANYTGSGTPLAEASFLPKSKAQEYARVNVHTVEALAALDGRNLANLGMGARDHKEAAQAYLDAAQGTAKVLEVSQENKVLKDEMSELREKMAEIVAQQGKPAAPSQATEPDEGANPFATWDEQAIRDWMKDAGAPAPDGRIKKQETLADLAWEHGKKREEARAAA